MSANSSHDIYISALMSQAVYEHAAKFQELPRLQNMYQQLLASEDQPNTYDSSGASLPTGYVRSLKDDALSEAKRKLKQEIDECKKTPCLETLARMGWDVWSEQTSVARNVGVKRGLYAIPFFKVREDHSGADFIIAFRGTSSTFNWIDNIQLFMGANLWPITVDKVNALAAEGIGKAVTSAELRTDETLLQLATEYVDLVRAKSQVVDARLRTTGHSLGGYLALMEAIRLRVAAVTCDNPGWVSRSGFMLPASADVQRHCAANVTELVSSGNAVNTIGKHHGQLLCVPMPAGSSKDAQFLADGSVFRAAVSDLAPIKVSTTLYHVFLNVSLRGDVCSLIKDRFVNGLKWAAGGFGIALFAKAYNGFGFPARSPAYPGAGRKSLALPCISVSDTDALVKYFPFLSATPSSHSMKDLLHRGFGYSGALQAFEVVRSGGVYEWPSASVACNLQENDWFDLSYHASGRVLAVGQMPDVGKRKLYQKLSADLASAGMEKQDLARELQAAQSRHVTLKQNLNSVQADVDAMQSRQRVLISELTRIDKARRVKLDMLASQQAKKRQASEKLRAGQGLAPSCRPEIFTASCEIHKLERELTELVRQEVDAGYELKEMGKSITNASWKKDGAHRKVIISESDCAKLQDQIATLREKINWLTSVCKYLRTKLGLGAAPVATAPAPRIFSPPPPPPPAPPASPDGPPGAGMYAGGPGAGR